MSTRPPQSLHPALLKPAGYVSEVSGFPFMHAMQPVEDDAQTRRNSGVEVTRPFPRVVKASHALGWLLIAVGLAEIVIGSLIFKGGVQR